MDAAFMRKGIGADDGLVGLHRHAGDAADEARSAGDLGGDDAVDLDLDFVAFAGDAVGIPVVALEGVTSAFAEGGFVLRIPLDRTDEPLSASFVVESARPSAVRIAIDFGLVAEDFVGLAMGAEHEATVGFAFGEENVGLEDEIAVGFFGDEKEFLVGFKVDFAIDDFSDSPFIGVFPAVEGFAIEEWCEVFCEECRCKSEAE